jgi:nitrite reductase/ring-hydroxylating ferredoxin subunit
MVEVLSSVDMNATNPAATATTTLGNIADFPVDSLRMVRVGDRRICLVHTATGVHAIDNACPHEGYGLTQGSLAGNVLTCQWHNWKFRVDDGACVLGEEDVVSHPVTVSDDGTIAVTLATADPAAAYPKLVTSLRRGIERDYIGQVSRDVVRLLKLDANPGELVWEAIAYGAPRAEFGWGHSIASATDCLAMVDNYDGDARTLPIVQAISGISETERDRPVNPLPNPVATLPPHAASVFRSMVQAEDLDGAQALVRGAIAHGLGAHDLRPWFTSVVSDHHLSYGHGAIYAQKAFELLDYLGWERADTVLPHLVPTLVYGTREDTLPYMKPFMRSLAALDLGSLTERDRVADWTDDGRLLDAILNTSNRTAAIDAAADALRSGAGVDGVLNVVTEAVSMRMLRYDTAGEFEFHDDFGWLDITHGLTYANAARWHHAHMPGPDTVRLALFSVFLAHWTGRHEWHTSIAPTVSVDLHTTDIATAGLALQHEALGDRTSQFIVFAHAVKMSRAATQEAALVGSLLPLQATARFMREPRLERFVARTVTQSIDFITGKTRRDD